MWHLVAREPRPDAPDWPGRRRLAVVDANVGPLLWVLLIQHAPEPVGLMGPFVTALAILLALGRLHRTIWAKQRDWFTTWRRGKVMAAMLWIGAVLKVTMTARAPAVPNAGVVRHPVMYLSIDERSSCLLSGALLGTITCRSRRRGRMSAVERQVDGLFLTHCCRPGLSARWHTGVDASM